MAHTTGAKRTRSEWRADAVKSTTLNAGISLWALVIAMACAAGAVSYAAAPNVVGVLGGCLALNMILIALYDWRYFIIPNRLNLLGLLLGLVHAGILGSGVIIQAAGTAMIRGLVTALVFFALRVLYAALRGRQGLGLGDVKLAVVAGVWLDWLIIPVAVQMAALAALSLYLLQHLVTGQSISTTKRVPFGFFLAPTIWMCWVLQTLWIAPY